MFLCSLFFWKAFIHVRSRFRVQKLEIRKIKLFYCSIIDSVICNIHISAKMIFILDGWKCNIRDTSLSSYLDSDIIHPLKWKLPMCTIRFLVAYWFEFQAMIFIFELIVQLTFYYLEKYSIYEKRTGSLHLGRTEKINLRL